MMTRMTRTTDFTRWHVWTPLLYIWLALLVSSLFNTGHAQAFNANVYYQQCLRFEARGDLENARQSCLNAVELGSNSAETKLALARIDLALGNVAQAENRLNEVRSQTQSAEPYILLAETALQNGRFLEAESFLMTARGRLSERFNAQLENRLNFAAGKLAEARRDFPTALSRYRSAAQADRVNVRYTLALSRLLFALGDAAGAQAELENYARFTGNSRNVEILSLLGRTRWAQSDLEGAVRALETAVTLRGSRDTSARAEDLSALALVYYGQGDTEAGGLALREATRRGTLLFSILNRSVLWLALLVVLAALHLVGESQVVSKTSSAETPALWTIGNIYTVLFTSLAVAAGAMVTYSVVRYDNFLAVVTPLQGADVRALFYALLSLLLFGFALARVSKNGFDSVDLMLGGADKTPLGVGLGVLMLGVTVAYLAFKPEVALLQGFYLDFSRLTPTLVAAAVLVPLSEVFFRAFAVPPLLKRYPQLFAAGISGALSALVFAAPIPLMLLFGVALAELFRRTGSGLAPLTAQLVLHLGLIIGVAFSPWMRGLFF